MSEYSSQLENEREINKKAYLEKDQQLMNVYVIYHIFLYLRFLIKIEIYFFFNL